MTIVETTEGTLFGKRFKHERTLPRYSWFSLGWEDEGGSELMREFIVVNDDKAKEIWFSAAEPRSSTLVKTRILMKSQIKREAPIPVLHFFGIRRRIHWEPGEKQG